MAKITSHGFVDDGSNSLQIEGKLHNKTKFDLSPHKGVITKNGITVSDVFDTGSTVTGRAHLELKSVSDNTKIWIAMYTSHIATGEWRQVGTWAGVFYTYPEPVGFTAPVDKRAMFLCDRYLQARYKLIGPLFAENTFEVIINVSGGNTGQQIQASGTSLFPSDEGYGTPQYDEHISHMFAEEPGWGGNADFVLNTTDKLTGGKRLLFQIIDGPPVAQQGDCVVYGLDGNGDPVTETVTFPPGIGNVVITETVFTEVERIFFPGAVDVPGYSGGYQPASFTARTYVVTVAAYTDDATDPAPPISVEINVTGEVA